MIKISMIGIWQQSLSSRILFEPWQPPLIKLQYLRTFYIQVKKKENDPTYQQSGDS